MGAVQADATEFTFYLRKGIKWSDGDELTTDDVKFWWEDIMGNKDLIPPSRRRTCPASGSASEWKPAKLTIVDKYTWKVKYPPPNPLLPIGIAKNGGWHGHANVVCTGIHRAVAAT